MKLNVKLSIALVALVAGTFGLASKSFAEATSAKTGNGSNATPAAAAAIFSLDGRGNVTGGAVAASVGLRSAAAAVTKSSIAASNGSTAFSSDSTTAASLGSDKTLNLKVNTSKGSVDFTTVEAK